MNELLRRLRGAVGNAVVWSVGWMIAGVGIVGAGYGLGLITNPQFLSAAASFGLLGFLTGGAFSLYLGSVGRSQRLHELSAGRSALFAGVLAGSLVPLLRIGLELLGVHFLVPVEVLLLTSVLPAVLGSLTAFGTIRIAQGALGPGDPLQELPTRPGGT